MKLLQTGDLHLGKTLYEHSLYDDQKDMLNQLHIHLLNESYAALIITGDVYDRSIPSLEAVELFSQFLSNIKESLPQLHIYILPGNHDSAKRLSFAQQILAKQHIYISKEAEYCHEPFYLEKDGEKAHLYAIPFLASGALSNSPDQSQASLMQTVVKRISVEKSTEKIPSIVAAHLFTVNAEPSHSERRFWGTAEQVNIDIFAPFDYCAFGHVHKMQRVSSNAYYAGAPLAYSFDETGSDGQVAHKCFLKIEIDSNYNKETSCFPVQITQIPIQPLHALRRFRDTFYHFYESDTYKAYSTDFLEFELSDTAIIENPMALLRPLFPRLARLKQEKALQHENTHVSFALRAERNAQGLISITDDFDFFLNDVYGSDDETHISFADKKHLFEQLVKQEEAYESA